MAISTSLIFVLSCIFLGVALAEVVENRKVYIVYLGERQHEDPELTEKSHYDMLAEVVGSKELASELMVHNYKHGFSGFAAKLSEAEAQKIAEHPDVIHVTLNTLHKLQTTRSWDYMGLSSPMPNNLLGKGNQGDGIIIGVVDSGIWPESKSFSDEGLGPIPSRWKGTCVSGNRFNATEDCNRKIIGAQYFMDGYLADYGNNFNMTAFEKVNYVSPRDMSGHGTHVAGTAAGSYVGNASYYGLGVGTLRGGAPKARIAVYKVCWQGDQISSHDACMLADIAKAIDQAIHDGVDVLQLSVGGPIDFLEIDTTNYKCAMAALHAVKKGITVVYAGGNDGPDPQSISMVEPWVITVGASTTDRKLLGRITLGDHFLGNSNIFHGRAIWTQADTGFKELVGMKRCEMLANATTTLVGGKVVVCFSSRKPESRLGVYDAIKAGAAGIIVAKNNMDLLEEEAVVPIFEVDKDVGNQIFMYMLYARSLSNITTPTVRLSPTKVLDNGRYASAKVASFSSRGPNMDAPAILKPDIIAPGVNILAATIPLPDQADDHHKFGFMSGTSMAAPHVSGIVALLKEVHPDWSPAAMKSALMTTAWNTNRHGLPIFAEGLTNKDADAFDMGAGIVNPNGAMNPGLVYDMDMNDYTHYFCAFGYDNATVFRAINQTCPGKRPSMLDFNLPSITIPSLRNSTTLTRTVTNVGRTNSVYKAVIEAPRGTVISVRPKVLVFNAKKKKISFKVNVYLTYQMSSEYYNFGSLTWTDGVHAVRSPIAVKTDVELPFDF